MKKKTLPLLSLVLCGTMLFTACGGGSGASIAYTPEDAVVYNSVTQITELDGFTKVSETENLVYLTKTDASTTTNTLHKIYNKDTGGIVESNSAIAGSLVYEITNDYFISVENSSSTIYTKLYDLTGDEVAVGKADELATNYNGLVKLGSKYYGLNAQGVFSEIFDGKFKTLPNNVLSYNDDYALASTTTLGVTNLFLYDKTYEVICQYQLPSYVNLDSTTLLPNGKVIVQYLTYVDSQSNDYEVLEMLGTSSVKYNVDTKVMNPDGKVTDLNTDMIFNNVYLANRTSSIIKNSNLDEKYIAMMTGIQKIENKQLSSQHAMYGITADLGIDRIETMFDKQNPTDVATVVGEETYIYNALNGQKILVNKDGEEKLLPSNVQYNDNFILIDGELYDYNLAKINTDLSKAISLTSAGTAIITFDGRPYFIYKADGTETPIAWSDYDIGGYIPTDFDDNFVAIVDAYPDTNGHYRINLFNMLGEEIATLKTNSNNVSLSSVFAGNPSKTNKNLFGGLVNELGVKVYYKVSATNPTAQA